MLQKIRYIVYFCFVLSKYRDLTPWCGVYHYCTISSTEPELRFCTGSKHCLRLVEDSWWWESLTMDPAGHNVKRLSSVKHTTKTIIIIIIIKWTKWTISYYQKLTGKNKRTIFTKYLQIVTKNTKNVNWKQNRLKWNIFSSREIYSQATNFHILISCK